MKIKLLPILFILTLFCSCKVDFSPNAPWKDVPAVYCVMDIDDDTVWARVQRCYLGEDNLYNYSTIIDSNNYPIGAIRVELLAWKGIPTSNNQVTMSDQLVQKWDLTPTMVERMPNGDFSSEPQPVYYCVPGKYNMRKDSNCVFQLLVIRNESGDTLAQSTTTLVKHREFSIQGHDTTETVIESPNAVRGYHFGFIPATRNKISWYTVPRGRIYQPLVRFYYRKNGDTLGIDIPGTVLFDEHNNLKLSSTAITQYKFLTTIKAALADNTDSLFNVNFVDIRILVGNEDLNCYINAQNAHHSSGQEYSNYTNIDGGVGIFGSRRMHIVARVPSDSTGKPDYLPDQLVQLGVGFYGHFSDGNK